MPQRRRAGADTGALAAWKPTNPGIRGPLQRYAALRPRLTLREAAIAAKRAEVEDFPEQEMRKPPLKRIVFLSAIRTSRLPPWGNDSRRSASS